jgi:hypothetical protein
MLPAKDPDKQRAALETIQTLNLQHENLTAMREAAIISALQGLEELTYCIEHPTKGVAPFERKINQSCGFSNTF